MSEAHIPKIAQELGLIPKQVQATADLLNEGATVPFIARYRKEATGSLDEVAITAVRDRLNQLVELDKRREAILKSLEERGQLTDELKEKILSAETMVVLEDIYLPYRPKRRTRATVAKEKGLEPLAQRLFAQDDMDPLAEAAAFVDPEKGVDSAEDALAGARDIIAEWVNEDQTARARMRDFYSSKAVFKSKVIPEKEAEGIKYKDYFDWEEPVNRAPSHRILAMRRGEKEGFLTLRVLPPEDEALEILDGLFVKGEGPASQQVRMAVHDSYKRLLSPSMETEIRLATKKRADEEAIRVFVENFRQLLLAPPLSQKNVLAIDPGFRTGCKVVCLDRQGKLLHTETIYPLQSEKGAADAGSKIFELCERFHIEAIAVGNGTAGRETETFIRSLDDVVVSCVNGVGVEVNTASKQLLTYVSGLGPQLAKGIVEYRNEHGPFQSRDGLKQVPRLGPKAFEQAVGFLRIRDGENPLDRSAVHPESYPIVDAMARDLGCSVLDLMRDEKLREKIDLKQYVSEKVGLPTLNDILSELSKPGRDPREQFEAFRFAEGVEKIEDVKPGMKLPGIVTNVTAFGVFVDIGVHQDGLVHISELSNRFVKNPAEVVKVHQKVLVTVLDVDLERKRISLSMKGSQPQPDMVSKEERKKEEKRQERRQKQKSTFTNNPFDDAFRNRNQ